MDEKNILKISMDDPVFSPLILLSIHRYLKEHKEREPQSSIIYNLTLQTLGKLDFFPPAKPDPTSFAMGIHIYSPIFENSIKQLEEQGLVEREDKKLVLTDDGFKVMKSLVSRFKAPKSPDIFQILDEEISTFNENSTIQAKVIIKGHKEIITQLRKIGSQMDQHFPNYLSTLETQLLCVIYRSENKKCTKKEIKKFTYLMKNYNKNSPYKALKSLEKKGFLKNYGEGLVSYELTKLGKVQAKWYAGREIS
jgi:predicted transcriptional regulator